MGTDGDEAEPKTRPWPLNLPDDEDEKGLLTLLINKKIITGDSGRRRVPDEKIRSAEVEDEEEDYDEAAGDNRTNNN